MISPKHNNNPMLCKYTYKACYNPRTTKKNGDLHMLCDYHRDKANEVQKTHAKKRKLLRAAQKAALLQSPPPTTNVLDLQFLSTLLDDAWAPLNVAADSTALTEDECAILFALF
ncbi:hypothetical protein SPRG_13593 [Saprolegnia parasitica CBS 223.65]|uniref:Uncharacterized protein n=1 Tax=Saprolegnia parasitica (strain CBS 223.65) TaxID=695850 RepID=A0A067BS23_SAPPC|nr:hypothetical protein SPRG_13593 [Saprolegnia parasitica CBS 223.65]KDO21294.1 hypothetical protein SPRG_13593 [Saprolegnia parasitica CBS 223.65]|eukprot:XP_012208036.1 hypothetical protein SPRG_13593 [Saprolegnia parasitica CBS 223.65]